MSSAADLTAAARIRDAAIRLFGAQGFERTSVRSIADAAEVSPALVIHHFGSKDALRDVCDEWIAQTLMGEKAQLVGGGSPQAGALIQQWIADGERVRPLLDYLATMLIDGDRGSHLFDRLVAETEAMLDAGVADGTMTASSDPRTRALIITMHGLAPLVLRAQLERALGGGLLDAAQLARLTIPTLELYTDGLYADTRMLDAARAALGTTSTTAPHSTPHAAPGKDPA